MAESAANKWATPKISGAGAMNAFSMFLGYAGMMSGIYGAYEQERIDLGKVELEYKSNLEDIRRRKFQIEYTKGATKALSETAGVRHTGGSTAQEYLNVMTREFGEEIKFMEDYAKEARRLGRKQAKLRKKGGIMSSVTEGFGSMFG